MKPTLLFALLTTVFAMPRAAATTELETLRARCAAQEQQIQRLEGEVRKFKPATSATLSSSSRTTTISTPTRSTAGSASHVVRAGESLERIARRHGCSVATLAKANKIKTGAVIHPGQKLVLPGSASAVASPAVAAATPKPAAQPAAVSGKSHTISSGETFASISRKHKVSVASLISANPTVKPTALRPGQVIRLSSEALASAVANKPAAKPAPAPAVAPAAPRTQMASAQASPRSTAATIPISTNEPAPVSSTLPVSAPLPPNTLPAPEKMPEAAAAAAERRSQQQ